MSQTAESPDEATRTPGLLTTALQPLRLPLALALLAYLVLRFLISLFRIAFGETSFANRAADQHGNYIGLLTLLLLAVLVALVMAREPLELARPIVLVTLALTGFALLFGVIGTLVHLFETPSFGVPTPRDKIEGTLLDLPALALFVLFALFLVTLLSEKGLPRAAKPPPRPSGGQFSGAQQQGGIPGFPPIDQPPYGYQQQPQNQAYDPWHGYPQQGYPQQGYQQQGYQQQPYQQEQPPYQPYQQEQAAYQPQQQEQPPYQEQAPYQEQYGQTPWQQQPEPAPYPLPPEQAPYPPQPPYGQPVPADLQPEPAQEPQPPEQETPQSPFAPYRPPTDELLSGASAPPLAPQSWPQQPTQSPSAAEETAKRPDDGRPEDGPAQQEPTQIQDWYRDRRGNDAPPDPPPYAGWSGPHL